MFVRLSTSIWYCPTARDKNQAVVMNAKQKAAADIRSKFPDAKVLFHDGLFNKGLGVEIMVDRKPVRNAYAFSDDTPENWRGAADRLIKWLHSELLNNG